MVFLPSYPGYIVHYQRKKHVSVKRYSKIKIDNVGRKIETLDRKTDTLDRKIYIIYSRQKDR